MPEIQHMIGKEVIVMANGMRYTGVLVEVSDAEVHLKGTYQWIMLPASSVGSITLEDAGQRNGLDQYPEEGLEAGSSGSNLEGTEPSSSI
jgi:hypothetical protein